MKILRECYDLDDNLSGNKNGSMFFHKQTQLEYQNMLIFNQLC